MYAWDSCIVISIFMQSYDRLNAVYLLSLIYTLVISFPDDWLEKIDTYVLDSVTRGAAQHDSFFFRGRLHLDYWCVMLVRLIDVVCTTRLGNCWVTRSARASWAKVTRKLTWGNAFDRISLGSFIIFSSEERLTYIDKLYTRGLNTWHNRQLIRD